MTATVQGTSLDSASALTAFETALSKLASDERIMFTTRSLPLGGHGSLSPSNPPSLQLKVDFFVSEELEGFASPLRKQGKVA